MRRRPRSPRPDPLSRLRQAARRVPTRLYMSLTLGSVLLFGTVLSAGLLGLGMSGPMARWGAVALGCYALFVLLCRVALSPLVEAAAPGHEDRLLPRTEDLFSGASDAPELIDLAIPRQVGGSAPEAPDLSAEDFGGGGSGGGGAGLRWEGPDLPHASPSSSGDGLADLGDVGDVDGEGVVALLLIGVLVALLGASLYVVYAAPTILTEAAFEVLLAAGLARAARRRGWATAILRSTALPFLAVFLLILAAGWASERYCPTADRLSAVLSCLQDPK